MLSTCCNAPPYLGNWHMDRGVYYGICENCREHCEFEEED
jgi:hypothetical protein